MGRDATVSWGGPEFVFKNDLDHAIPIKVSYTDATFTVTFYGTKQGPGGRVQDDLPHELHAAGVAVRRRPGRTPNSVRRTAAGGPGFDVTVSLQGLRARQAHP